MKLVEGGTLAERISEFGYQKSDRQNGASKAGTRERERTGALLISKLARALAYAHQRGVLHRDIKPSNILINAEGEPQLTDFGLAKIEDRASGLTLSNSVLGSPAYMAPEQAAGKGRDVTTAADVYGLGAVLYELLAGRPPFNGQTVVEVIRKVLDDEPAPPSHSNPAVDRDLETISLKCLEKNPARRYGSADSLAQDLQRWLQDEPIQARPVSSFERFGKWVQRNPKVATLAILLAVVLGLAITMGLWMGLRVANQAEQLRRKLYTFQIFRAASALEENNLPAAHMFLDECPKDLRHWEWNRINWTTSRTNLSVIAGAERPLFTPDGQYLVSAGGLSGPEANVIKMWDASTGRAIRTFNSENVPVASTGLSPDGKWIAAAHRNGAIVLWNANSGRSHWTVPGHSRDPDGLAFSPDGHRLASVGGDGMLKLWDVEGGTLQLPIGPLTYPLRDVVFSPKGDVLATAADRRSGPDGLARLWDATTGKEIAAFRGHADATLTVAFSPDGLWIVTGSLDHTLKIWNATNAQLIRTLSGHSAPVWTVAFSPDGKRIVSGGGGRTLRFWDAASGTLLATLQGHTDIVYWLSFSPDGGRVASFGDDGIRVWGSTASPEAWTLTGHFGYVDMVEFSPNGQEIASRGDDNSIKVWDTDTGMELLTLHGCWGPALAYHPTGKLIASGGMDASVLLWDGETGQEILALRGHTGSVTDVSFRPDGARLASASADKTIRIWNVTNGEPVLTIPAHRITVSDIAYFPDGTRIGSSSFDGTVKVWDAGTGRLLHTLTGHEGSVRGITISSDGARLASAGIDQTIRIWNTLSGRQLQILRGHSGRVQGMAFSRDGQRLFSNSADGTLKVWNPASGEELLTLRAHYRGAAIAAAVSPDGRAVASTGEDWTLKLWETGPPPGSAARLRPVVERARKIVDARFDTLNFAQEVLASLQSDPTLDRETRELAVRIVTARGERDKVLNDESWAVVRLPGGDLSRYRQALRMAEVASRVVPRNGEYLNTLGAARYRLGEYTEALITVRKGDEVQAAIAPRGHPAAAAISAMAFHELGRHEEARAEVNRLRALMKAERWAGEAELETLSNEAESRIAGRVR